jgi:radical SAM superfamily enzyme YgiQ (UPF0313 family)
MATLPLGLACVAAATRRAGHDAVLADMTAEEDWRPVLKKAIEEFRPDVIGISVRNIDDQNMGHPRFLLDSVKEIITSCRSLSTARIILGGAGYSIFPESCLSFLGGDMGIQGEGEAVFPEFLERIEKGADVSGLPGLCLPGRGSRCRRSFIKDLDQFLLPDLDLCSASCRKEEVWMPVQTRRGCPLGCSYCSTEMIEGRAVRRRSPQSIVRWIARCRREGIHQFYFVDNTFNLPISHAKEICRRLIDADLDIRWWGILYPRWVDEELVEWMVRAGCKQVALGFESGSERILKNMKKRFTLKEVRRISDLLAEHGVRRMGFLLLGSPGETQESVEESLRFADSLHLDQLKVTVGVRIYPHTSLAKAAEEEGLISREEDLLFPRFYLARGLENRLPETVKKWMMTRPHWSL